MLERSLDELGNESGDKHIEDLANRIRSLQHQPLAGATKAALHNETERVRKIRVMEIRRS